MLDQFARTLLRDLTVLEHKAALFGDEPFAREACRDLLDLTDADGARRLLRGYGTMLVKAESVALRAVDDIAQRLEAAGFIAVAAWPLIVDRQTIRALWWHVLNAATLDRLDLLDLFKPAGDSIMLFLRDETTSAIPAAVRLQQFKGPTLPEQRGEEHLRYHLGPPNRLLNFVHAADEPADVLRELGLLFDRPARREVISLLLAGEPAWADLPAARDAAYARTAAHDLRAKPAFERFGDAVVRVCPPEIAARAGPLLDGLLSLPADDAARRWSRIHALLWPYAVRIGVWDYVVVGSSVCSHDVPGAQRVIPDPVHGRWDELWATAGR